jgi:choline kinase
MTIKHIKRINEPTAIDIVIPAAGLGKRMKSYGPKPLIAIKNNQTIIDNQLRIFKKFLPNANIILVCGFQADTLMNNTPNNIIKVENERHTTTNVVRSLGLGLRASQRDVLLVYGDLVFNDFCLDTLNLNKSSLLVEDNCMGKQEVGCTIGKNNKLEYMMYDLPKKWGQMVFLKGRELSMFKEICWNPENYNMFGFEAINQVLSMGGEFTCCSNKKAKAMDIDSSKDLERVSEIV